MIHRHRTPIPKQRAARPQAVGFDFFIFVSLP